MMFECVAICFITASSSRLGSLKTGASSFSTLFPFFFCTFLQSILIISFSLDPSQLHSLAHGAHTVVALSRCKLLKPIATPALCRVVAWVVEATTLSRRLSRRARGRLELALDAGGDVLS